MHEDELNSEIAEGVTFWGHEDDGVLVGVMGMQSVRDVDLIRHAYVLPSNQGRGIGDGLLRYLRQSSTRRMLVGTWDAAVWAIRCYRRHGLELSAGRRRAVNLLGANGRPAQINSEEYCFR